MSFLFKKYIDYVKLSKNCIARIPKKKIFSQFERKMLGGEKEEIGK